MPRPKKTSNYIERLESEIQAKQSKVSMILGALIIIVIGVLIFNYFNKNKASLGPAQQTSQTQEDVSPEALPGQYTVKDGDTLYEIAKSYYKDGFQFETIAKVNNLISADQITAGQILNIPKLEVQEKSQLETKIAAAETSGEPLGTGTGGGDSTIWGPKIEGNTYTVAEDDWLSKIAGRTYGDIMAFDKIAKANSIPNPDHIEPGQVLTIPR